MHLRLVPKTNRGFMFMELMVVVAIIGILAGIAIPSYIRYRPRSFIAQVTDDLKKIQRAVQDLGHDTGRWPTGSIAGVAKAMGTGTEIWGFSASAPTTDPGWNDWQGPYLSGPFTDPWDMNYYFDEDCDIGGGNAAAVVASFGPDKVGPTTYDDNNIIVKEPANQLSSTAKQMPNNTLYG